MGSWFFYGFSLAGLRIAAATVFHSWSQRLRSNGGSKSWRAILKHAWLSDQCLPSFQSRSVNFVALVTFSHTSSWEASAGRFGEGRDWGSEGPTLPFFICAAKCRKHELRGVAVSANIANIYYILSSFFQIFYSNSTCVFYIWVRLGDAGRIWEVKDLQNHFCNEIYCLEECATSKGVLQMSARCRSRLKDSFIFFDLNVMAAVGSKDEQEYLMKLLLEAFTCPDRANIFKVSV